MYEAIGTYFRSQLATNYNRESLTTLSRHKRFRINTSSDLVNMNDVYALKSYGISGIRQHERALCVEE